MREDIMVDPSAMRWRKSSYSGANGCVEAAFLDDRVAVRHSKEEHGGTLLFTASEWQMFLDAVRNGEFDVPDRTSTHAQ
jgi:hypothetical protein